MATPYFSRGCGKKKIIKGKSTPRNMGVIYIYIYRPKKGILIKNRQILFKCRKKLKCSFFCYKGYGRMKTRE